MTATPLEYLKNKIVSRHAVVVIGSGVSVALTENAPTASWVGLIRSGVERAASFNHTLPPDWKEHLLRDLEYAEGNNYLPGLLSIAEQVTNALGGLEGGDFRAWLRDAIGQLEVTSSSGADLTNAIDALGLPIATTNYDSLLETSLSRSWATWQDASTAQQIIQGVSKNILHLHGSWESPSSVIFGSGSYGQLLADRPAQAIEQILAGGSTLIFVGCGDGLADPNFQSLRNWLEKTFPSSETYHYRLCLEKEIADLAKQHQGERIIPVAYGETYAALAQFVSTLVPEAGIVIPPECNALEEVTVQQRAVDAIHARVRTETVMADHLEDVETRNLDSILIPPVLLPMTSEQFAQAMTLAKAERPKRCNPCQDVRDYECILVISDVTAGLTSSLEWLVTQSNYINKSLTPVVVDFRTLGKGPRPLERQVRKELRLAGVALGPEDPLPKMAIALDNVTSRPDKIFSRALDELKDKNKYNFCVVGCHEGSEAEIVDRLAASGRDPVVRYIGKLSKRDAMKMAALMEPARAGKLAEKAMRIAHNECLPRTPLTIGLLICMLLRGETLLSTASPTALLDAWVNLLLGRGDPHDDARFALDSVEKADILAFLAERFVEARAGSLSESEAIAHLDHYFTEVGWKEDPIEVLGNFRMRYLLRISNGQVRFAQSSYLHLFAAKRAKDSQEFRGKLYGDLLYFGPIIRHYAALTRNDDDLLGRVEQLLSPSDPDMPQPAGRNFSSESGEETPESSIEDLLGQLSLPPGDAPTKTSHDEGEDQQSTEGDAAELAETWLDQMDDSDREPFPVEDIENAPPVLRIMTALNLASTVLRDSELVRDLDLKERVLRRTLLIWGKFADLLDADEEFIRFWEKVANELCELLNISAARRSKFVEDFSSRAPVLMGFHGVSSTLSSRKLLRSLDACFSDPEFLANAAGSVMAAFMGYDVHMPGWAGYFLRVQHEHGRIRAVSDTMHLLAEDSYYHEKILGNEDAGDLLTFLVSHYSRKVNHRTGADRKRAEATIAQQLKRNRALFSGRQPMSIRTVRAEIEEDISGE